MCTMRQFLRFDVDGMRLWMAGILVSAFLIASPLGAGAAENVLDFDAKTDIVTTTGRITTVAFTVEAWVRMTTAQSENQICGQYVGGDPGRMIIALQNDRPGFFIAGWMTGNPVDFTNKWTHIAVTRTNATCSIYINGVLNKTGTINANTRSSTGITIGGLNIFNSGFRGQIADVRVWNIARSVNDIASSMHIRLAGDEAGLIHYWRLDEGLGSAVVHDSSPADATGAISGAAWTTSDLPILSGVVEGAWSSTTGGNWSEPANWLGGVVAQGNGGVGYFTNASPQAISVTNNLAGLLLGQWRAENASGCVFSGNGVTMTNGLAAACVTSTNGSHTFALPLTATTYGLSIDSASASALSFIGGIGGNGALSVNPKTSGGGIVTMSDANTYTGATVLGCGTLSVGVLANGGAASGVGASSSGSENLVLGPGTLHYTGSAVTTDRGYTVAAGASPVRAAILDAEADITFGGQILATSGAFIKTGSGTVFYTYPGSNTLNASAQGTSAFVLQDTGATGDGPTTGFAGFNINQGRVVLGAPGQTNVVNGRVIVGLFTTTNANAETAGELVVNDGALLMGANSFGVGWQNGTFYTAGAGGVQSRVVVNGGYVQAGALSLGLNNQGLVNFNAHPAFVQNGGTVELNVAVFSESSGAVSQADINGGTLRILSSYLGNGIRLGEGGEATVTIRGNAVVDVAQYIRLAVNAGATSKGRLNLDGGTLIAPNILKGSGDEAVLCFNGGSFCPRTAGQTLAGLTAAYVSTNGAVFDLSRADFTVAQSLFHDPDLGDTVDGGLVKLGTNALTFAASSSTYTGPTAVSNGVLRLLASLPAASLLNVAPEGEVLVGGNATQVVSVSSLAVEPGGVIGFAFVENGSTNDLLACGSSPSLVSGRIALYLQGSELPFTKNGTYTVLTYSGDDPVLSGLTPANPVFGKTYTFEAIGHALRVTIATATAGAAVWNVSAGGAWGTSGNWTAAPTFAAGDRVRFDDAISTPVTVTTANEKVGEIYFNNSAAGYTLGGVGLTLDNDGAPASVSVESGAHAVTAPLALAGDAVIQFAPSAALTLGAVSGESATLTAQGGGTLTLTAAPAVGALVLDVSALATSNSLTLSPGVSLLQTVTLNAASNTAVTLGGAVSGGGGLMKAGSSTLTLAAANSTYTGPTTLRAGTLSVGALANGGSVSAIGASSAAAANLVLGPGTFRYTGSSNAVNRGYTVSAGSSPIRATVMHVTDYLAFGGQILSSSGSFIKTGAGTLSYTYAGPSTLNTDQSANPFAVQNIGVNGDGPTVGFAGYTIDNGTVVMGVPGQTNTVNGRLLVGVQTTTAAGAETSGELIVNDGVVVCNSNIGIAWNNGTTVTAGSEGTHSRIVVNGGALKGQILSAGLNNQNLSNFNAKPSLVLNGGTVELSGSLVLSETAGAVSGAEINGGLFKVTGNTSGNSIRIGGSGEATFTVRSNAVVDAAYTVRLAEYSGTSCKGTLTLEGGTFIAPNILKGSGAQAVLRFNGGTFSPRTAGQTMSGLDAVYVSTNGAAFDTSRADGYTVAQSVLTDPALAGASDGGLIKLGTNTLSLTGTGNTFSGPVEVRQGLLRARFGGTNDLAVVGSAVFDALGERATVGNLSGSGLLTNGVIAVTGRLDAGTNGVPAGASLTVENLSLGGGAVMVCDWATNGLGQVTNDFVAVTGALAPEGSGVFDLGRTEDAPIPMPFELTVLSYGTLSRSFAGWKATNTGLPAEASYATIVKAVGGFVTIRIQYGGMLVIVK